MEATVDNAATRGFAAGEGAGSIGVPPVTTGQDSPAFAPFAVLTDGTVTLMYVPAGCVTVNGKAFSPTGLTEDATLTGWYVVTSFTSGLKMYVDFSDDDGLYGTPIAASFADSTPYSGLYLEIPILSYADGRFTSICSGALHLERTGLDSQGDSTTCKSLAKPGSSGGWTDEDHTMELHGFRSNTAPSGTIFDTDDSYSHSFAVREYDGLNAELRWVSDATVLAAIKADLLEDSEWLTDLNEALSIAIDWDYFWTWYDALDPAKRRFWEKGDGYSENYGTSIGSDSSTMVIDLSNKRLTSGTIRVDWGYYALYDSTEARTVEWNEAKLYIPVTGTEISIDWASRELFDSSPAASLDWQNRYLAAGDWDLTAGSLKVGGVQVVTSQQAAVADATGAGDVVAQLNALLAACRAHGLIAT